MTAKKTTRITFERDRIWIIRQCGSLARFWCESCAAEVELVSLEQAIALSGRSADEIKKLILAGTVHTSSGEGSSICLCLQSLESAVSQELQANTSKLNFNSGEMQ